MLGETYQMKDRFYTQLKEACLPHVHRMQESLQVLAWIQAADCSQVMGHVHHWVAHKNDQQKGFLYLDFASGFYRADAANSNCST